MSSLLAVAIVLLSAAVHATLQLGLGALLLLYHASLGKHVRAKTKNLVGSFISGMGMFILLGLAAATFMIGALADDGLPLPCLVGLVVILIMLAIVIWFFYYRRGRSTELWLPKVVARYINNRAKVTESNTEAFSLGLLASFGELPFTLVLTVIAANSILDVPREVQPLLAVVYTMLAILPLVIMRISIRRGNTVVDIQRWRVKNKVFLRIISGVLFLTLGLFLLAFQVMGVV
ncbi:hypothetical protein IJG73_00200 [Candidatus Saccharibacteria bacterium]|nr:hypothetical protein [Candidatus Saccharibacteria bacterium]